MGNETLHKGGVQENPSVVPFKSAFWLVIILVGLYIAAVNFIAAESVEEKGEKKTTSEIKTSVKESESEKTIKNTAEVPKTAPKPEAEEKNEGK